MRLQPYQTIVLLFMLFMTGLLVAFLLAHGQTHMPGYAPFQAPR
jgi:hypothetical protein